MLIPPVVVCVPPQLSIQDLFMRSGCNTPAVRDLLGEDGITDSNLLSYLGIIEQRVHELLQVGME